MKNEMDSMKNEILNLREKWNKSFDEILKESEIEVKENNILDTIDKLLDKKLESVAEKLGKSILNELKENSKYIDHKLTDVIDENKSYAESVKVSLVNNDIKSPTTVTDLKSILNEAKNDQLL